ncbi:unnamed protein product [Oppiella nova]|uniref:Uncharacterized protein n=1 Tax=Oppiella nova TaxID=334625 RepID=A0A7R9L8J3_9ACAR|nr:unnamed protein product [Oppiella nova]CAG2158504.1 unnamed protein product [Oppiella nova]
MKQLSTLGARRHFFRSPRRAMRPLRPGLSPDGLEDSPEMIGGPNNGFGYFSDSSNPSEFQYGMPQPPHNGPLDQGFYDFFPRQGPPVHAPDGMVPAFMGDPSHLGHPAALAADAPFMTDNQTVPGGHTAQMITQHTPGMGSSNDGALHY